MAQLIGLTGGMGSGKSTVASLFHKKGAYVIDADSVCRDLVAPGQPALIEIQAQFGSEYLLPDGSLNRKKMAETVFQSPESRQKLENILHPRVFEEEKRRFQSISEENPDAMVILDAALLIESGNYRKVDKVVVVACNEEEQVERIASRGNFTPDEIRQRLKSQMPLKEKLTYADFIIRNEGTLENLKESVDRVFGQLNAA